MTLPGQFDVSPTGSALYTVPIEVPPGTAGMVPALTLDYDSNGGNGLLGVGWNLGGLPSIGRCPKTVAQDGVKGRVDFTSSDRFCMDGQRLVVVSGAYGAANSEYRTEIEGFTKVVAYGTAGNGPAYFKAWTKSGQIMEFGNTTDSRILAKGTSTARSWAANKISDTAGNYLTITYNNDTANGQAYPTRIDYTGNAGESVSPYNSVRFEYETRPDIVPQYIAGSMIKNTVRLKKIKTYEGASTVVRVHEIAYNTGSSTDRSRITSIKLCDGTGTNCLPATTFSMTTPSFGFPQSAEDPISYIDMIDDPDLYVGDWNGDGISDVMTLYGGDNKWYVNDGSFDFTIYDDPIADNEMSAGNSALYLGDGNGDGVTDVMWWNRSNGATKWFINDGSLGFAKTYSPITPGDITGANTHIFLGDWNGDGISDVMWWNPDTGTNKWFVNDGALGFTKTTNPISASELDNGTLRFGDWNGDGITDVLWWNPIDGSNDWYVNSGSASFAKTSTPISTSDLIVTSGTPYLETGDWNGDGVSDLLLFNVTWGSNKWFTNDGDLGFSKSDDPITASTLQSSAPYLGDWNADGVDDVMFFWSSGGTNRWFINDGALSFDYFSDPITPSEVFAVYGTFTFGDWNGDGIPDPLSWLPPGYSDPHWWNRWYYNGSYKNPDLMSSITTGLGSDTSITYTPLTDSSIYSRESSATYPIVDIQVPHYVVSRVDADDGVGGDYSSAYAYEGAKVDVSGRGFLGFHRQYATDLQTGVVQTLKFRQDYPFIGFVEQDRKHKSGENVTLNRKTNTYAATNLGGTRRFPYLSQSVEESADLDETAFPTVTTSYDYDAYGNPIEIVVSTPDGASRTTANTYSNNTSKWHLGRLLNATVTSVTPDVTPSPTGCQSNCNGDAAVFSIDDDSVTEGSPLNFTVTRAGGAGLAISVDYATANGTASAGSDYTSDSDTINFAPDETSKTVTIATSQDSVYENDETVFINLSNATNGATIADDQGAGTINNDDPGPSFAISNASATEGDAVTFTVTKSGSTETTHDIHYSTAGGTATDGVDYTSVTSGFGSFAPSETSKSIKIWTSDDSVQEDDETFFVNLLNATNGATITDSQGNGTIVDNDAGPTCDGGAIIDDVCYRLAAPNESCTQVCAAHGSCSAPLTRKLGSDAANDLACRAAMVALMGDWDTANDYSHLPHPSGCEMRITGDKTYWWYGSGTATTCSATPRVTNAQRACACTGDNP